MEIEFELPASVRGDLISERVLATVKLDTAASTLTVIVPTTGEYGYASEERLEFVLTPKGAEAA